MAEMGTVIGVRNAAISAATVASNGLSLLPSGRLCLALHLLRSLWLGALGALWLGFLGALCLRGFPRVLLRLHFLGVLRLLLVLRGLRFYSAAALFLIVFFCECWNRSSEK